MVSRSQLQAQLLETIGVSDSRDTTQKEILTHLSSFEKDCIRLYVEEGWSQGKIGRFFGVPQPAISLALSRSLRKIHLLNYLLPFWKEDFRVLFKKVFNPKDLQVLNDFLFTSSSKETARRGKISCSEVRNLVVRAVQVLDVQHPAFAEAFRVLLNNCGLLWRGPPKKIHNVLQM